eukprot:CAMPEP_0180670196 /NCGR_PEP_ID=MMETSP1037_2-20121125/63897_1 /TAXON_ID=632150 /ORGANISM="Azadinium spinosum, Strain 3D9" /LENGTH=60 /DNA_ID=CAMNT_0022699111 /DNA_START=53 /DNA_END=235 /DNA_ORIENTATION=+
MTFVSISSLESAFSGSPPQSDHVRNFSTSQASKPTGESAKAKPKVWGLVPCICWYAVSLA